MADTRFKKDDPRLIGNKFAEGCTTGGRPREVTPSPEECEKLGKEFLDWAKEDDKKEPHLRFAQWYSLEKGILRRVWKALIQVPEFLPYYQSAQAVLATRTLNPKILDKSFGHRYIRLYDRDLIEAENDHARFEAELRKLDPATAKELLIKVIDYSKAKV